jgi:branched-chain amino acid transport system ATP-binding protein
MRPLDTSIKVEDIHTYCGKSHILHGVCLEVGRGEVVGLLGRNGVGKSTTLKAIIRLVHPSQGRCGSKAAASLTCPPTGWRSWGSATFPRTAGFSAC